MGSDYAPPFEGVGSVVRPTAFALKPRYEKALY